MTAPAAGHTPGPYKVTQDDHGIVIRVCEASGKPVASMWLNGDDAKATAEFIVLAVNSRADLLKALERHVRAFKPFTMKPVGAPGSQARADQDEQIEAHKQALAALASARAPSSKGERM